jgi:Mlc titration factor MtfA (ptsG expression regulator)
MMNRLPQAHGAAWWQKLKTWLRLVMLGNLEITDDLWNETILALPFLGGLNALEQQSLRQLSAHFLDQKEFYGARGLTITDSMACLIAAQACLPLLHLGTPMGNLNSLHLYDDFVGIVVQPGPVVANREFTDDSGIVHHWREALAGESMTGGPVMLSWSDVVAAASEVVSGYNVVIHEFIHKIDMRNGTIDACPPLPKGFMGHPTARSAQQAWVTLLRAEWRDFREQIIRAERFGQPSPWLDAYGAESVEEFFAVSCEAYFVNRARFAADFSALTRLYDAYFRQAQMPS